MFDLTQLTVIPSICVGAGVAFIASALLDRGKNKGVQLYESTAEDRVVIAKLKTDLATATENADKVAEVHAYSRQLESKIQLLEASGSSVGSPDGELRVKVLEQQLAEKADLEGKYAVAMQQLNDYRAKAEMFDSVISGSPVSAVEPETVPNPVATPVAAPAVAPETPAPAMEVIENTNSSAEVIHTNGSSAQVPNPEPISAPALRVETPEPVVVAPAAVFSGSKDPLEKIDGIGQVYQQKLYEAGIYTFAQLAAASPSRITEVIEPQNWQHIDVMKWRREAALYAAGEKS